MTSFLLNMINRHQGMVDKVQPRIKSIYEPESATVVTTDNAVSGSTNATVKENLDAGFEKQSLFSKSPGVEKSTAENSPSADLSARLLQSAQTDKGFRASEIDSLDRNRLDLMNEQIQSMPARLSRKSKSPESFNDPNGLQKPASSRMTEPTPTKVVAHEMNLNDRIEETLGRLKSRTRYPDENHRAIDKDTHILSANASKTEAEPLVTVSPQRGKTVEESVINSQDGSLQNPAWLTDMQTSLNNRWRETHAKAQAESVINVTIGRVEVRAINTESATPIAAQKKPTGVLSLDEYLKQRESKGRT